MFELLRDACDLGVHARLGRFPTKPATDRGMSLGTLHSAKSAAGSDRRLGVMHHGR